MLHGIGLQGTVVQNALGRVPEVRSGGGVTSILATGCRDILLGKFGEGPDEGGGYESGKERVGVVGF